jgi:hypothetical protein
MITMMAGNKVKTQLLQGHTKRIIYVDLEYGLFV